MSLDPQSFATAWIAAWNRGDLEAILAHFTEDAEFVSPKAQTLVGTPRLTGKTALRAYWRTALERRGPVIFTLERALWDAQARSLVVIYLAALGDTRSRAAEVMTFDEHDHVLRGEALYGAAA